MKRYKQLTREQRYQIYGLNQAGLNQTQIAQKIGVHKSTIAQEFKRNKNQRGWRPKQAQSLCCEHKHAFKNKSIFH
jgi:IS30 family transposase